MGNYVWENSVRATAQWAPPCTQPTTSLHKELSDLSVPVLGILLLVFIYSLIVAWG